MKISAIGMSQFQNSSQNVCLFDGNEIHSPGLSATLSGNWLVAQVGNLDWQSAGPTTAAAGNVSRRFAK